MRRVQGVDVCVLVLKEFCALGVSRPVAFAPVAWPLP